MSSKPIVQSDQITQNFSSLEQPKITVAVVTYNGINVIKNCLDSLLNQTYKPTQILVVDNASTDQTPQWIEDHYSQVKEF